MPALQIVQMKLTLAPPLIDDDGEVRELTSEDFARFRPAHEVLPLELQKVMGMKPRDQASVTLSAIN